MAKAIVAAIKSIDKNLILLAPVLSALAKAGHAGGLKTAEEVFADRAYAKDGQLLPRGEKGAVIHDASQASGRAVAMFTDSEIITSDGSRHKITPHSICVHGDGANATAMAKAVKDGLLAAGFTAKPLPAMALA